MLFPGAHGPSGTPLRVESAKRREGWGLHLQRVARFLMVTMPFSSVRLRRSTAAVIAIAAIALTTVTGGGGRKFYDDDPLRREPETQDASGVAARDIELLYDLPYNLFARPGGSTARIRAQNVNTIDEVPDSSWFTNRILARPITIDELLRGPNTLDDVDEQRGVVTGLKSAGAAPGFVGRTDDGNFWFVTFDAAGHPEAATGALMVASKLFWALGYWQVEQYLTALTADDIAEGIAISPEATVRMPSGERRPLRRDDFEAVLARAHRSADGSYRMVAARRIPGRVIGGFRYHGTRRDDPNDIVPHEHRRELRALKVFGAWTNLVDIKAGNTLDTLIVEDGEARVRHYLQDVGSTFGSGANGPHDWDEGHEYLFEFEHFWKRLVSFGFYLRPWQTAAYEDHVSVGRFEADAFDPEAWRPRTPNGAFLNARDDDTFWAARRVTAFTDEMLRAVVAAGGFSDPAAERHLADMLIARRDRIGAAYLPRINPLVDFTLGPDGVLAFANAAVDAGVADAPGGYRAAWAEYDNDTGESRALGSEVRAAGPRIEAPGALPSRPGAFVRVDVSAADPPRASWTRPVHVYFKRADDGWTLVGLERMPE